MPVYQKIFMNIKKEQLLQKNTRRIFKAFHGLPGPKPRLFMGYQATELNHFSKPFKMDLNL